MRKIYDTIGQGIKYITKKIGYKTFTPNEQAQYSQKILNSTNVCELEKIENILMDKYVKSNDENYVKMAAYASVLKDIHILQNKFGFNGYKYYS